MKRFLLFIGLFFCSSAWAQNSFSQEEDVEKINGLNLVSMDRLLDTAEIEPMSSVNANWAAVIPFGFVPGLHEPRLIFNSDWQWIGERVPGVEAAVRGLHSQGINVMLKPQLWISHGDFTGHLSMNSEEDWQEFEANYMDFIMAYATIAKNEGVKMLCIGTEMNRFVQARPEFWQRLIKAVRAVYPGKLTYAENWDAYAQVPFWKELDHIGIDAYFPIAKGKNPKPKKLIAGWKLMRAELAAFAERHDRKMIFTEYGYRSIPSCAESPWDYSRSEEQSEKAQYNALAALYEVIWNEPFMKGGFLWKWHPDFHSSRHSDNDHFTVQNKKAEELVKQVYGGN